MFACTAGLSGIVEFNNWISIVFVQMSIFCCCTISDVSFDSRNKTFFFLLYAVNEKARKGLAFVTASICFSGKQARNEKVIFFFYFSVYRSRTLHNCLSFSVRSRFSV